MTCSLQNALDALTNTQATSHIPLMPTLLNELLATHGIRKSELADKADLSAATIDRLCNQDSYVASDATYGRVLHALNELRGGVEKSFVLEAVFPERFARKASKKRSGSKKRGVTKTPRARKKQ